MSRRDTILILTVMAVWGTNFVVIHEALRTLPPLLFAAMRFAVAFFPAALFIRRPDETWTRLAAYGLLIGVGQFGILYIAMDGGITPGLASLVIQMQVFFTIGLSVCIYRERLNRFQIFSLVLAASGIAMISFWNDGSTTLSGLLLTLFAAASWAAANILTRTNKTRDMLGFIVWSSLPSVPVLVLMSLYFEGIQAITLGLQQASLVTWSAVVWQSIGNTIFGYGVWILLLNRYPSSTIAPFALLVPLFGMAASALLLGEALQPWKMFAATLVIAGLAFNLLNDRFVAKLAAQKVRGA